MKRRTLTGIIAITSIGIATLIGIMNYRNNVPAPTENSRYIAEFVDRNNNRKFDGYKILKVTGDKREYVTTHYSSALGPEDPRHISFYTPFGGRMEGEFDREYLEGIHETLRYPDVDEIIFVE